MSETTTQAGAGTSAARFNVLNCGFPISGISFDTEKEAADWIRSREGCVSHLSIGRVPFLAAHTPGPWVAYEPNGLERIPGRQIKSINGTPIAIVFMGQGASKEAKEKQRLNACLIAAAPELLEAATRVFYALEGTPQAKLRSILSKAIAKATGADVDLPEPEEIETLHACPECDRLGRLCDNCRLDRAEENGETRQ